MVKAPERCQGVCTIFKGGQEKKIRFIEPSKSCMTNDFRVIKMIRCLLGFFCDLCFRKAPLCKIHFMMDILFIL